MNEIAKVVVVGAGTMGNGIAQICAQHGLSVTMTDVNDAAVKRGFTAIEKSLERLVQKGKLTSTDRARTLDAIRTGTDPALASANADLVIEAVPEKIELKIELLRTISASAPAHALLGSNTSSLSVTEIAGATNDPSRVIGLHFFNPVPIMELLEIVRGLGTSDETTEAARAFAARIGKRPIIVKDSPGFATSRLGVILGCEAIRMLEAGVGSVEDIDRAMELGYRHPMGPLKLTDLVGLDVRLAILEHLHREIGEQFRPPALLRQMVRAGRLGKKAGRGFYEYPSEPRS